MDTVNKCKIEGCKRNSYAKGYCHMHWQRQKLGIKDMRPDKIPPSNIKNLSGMRFGQLVVIKPTNERKHGQVVWLCRCDCGNTHKAMSHNLLSGGTQSCGAPCHHSGSLHNNWKGGKSTENGYILLLKPDHPNARKNGYIFEHVFVMSNILGRSLYHNETVHHKNGIRHDNDPKNLDLRLTNHHPSGQSINDDLIPYWMKMLKIYKPEVKKKAGKLKGI